MSCGKRISIEYPTALFSHLMPVSHNLFGIDSYLSNGLERASFSTTSRLKSDCEMLSKLSLNRFGMETFSARPNEVPFPLFWTDQASTISDVAVQ